MLHALPVTTKSPLPVIMKSIHAHTHLGFWMVAKRLNEYREKKRFETIEIQEMVAKRHNERHEKNRLEAVGKYD